MMRSQCRTAFLVVIVAVLTACATGGGGNAAYLLEQDYQQMTNPRLTAYEQELSEEISRTSEAGLGGVSLGFGFGSWGSHSGVGVGVDKVLGGGGYEGAPVELRNRRDAVRAEMRNRGLLPSVDVER